MEKTFFTITVVALLIVTVWVLRNREEQAFEYEGTAVLATEVSQFNSDRLEIYEIDENSESLNIIIYYNLESKYQRYRLSELYNLRNFIEEKVKQNSDKFYWCKHLSITCYALIDKDDNIPSGYISFYGSPHSIDSMEINSWCYSTEFENISLNITKLRVEKEFTVDFDVSMLKCFPQLKKLYIGVPVDDISQMYKYIPDDCEVELINQI